MKRKSKSLKNAPFVLMIEVRQAGVKQDDFIFYPAKSRKTITFGNSRTCDLCVEFGQVPTSMMLFRFEAGSFYVLIEPRLAGFINSGSEFGSISEFLSPEGAIAALATIADPYPVRLENNGRGVLQIGEFDILFKVDRPKPPQRARYLLEGAKAGPFMPPPSDSVFEANIVWIALAFTGLLFGPGIFWLMNAPIDRYTSFQDLPDEFLLQFVHPEHFRYLPKIYEKNYVSDQSVKLAVHWVSDLQKRWDAEDLGKKFVSDIPILGGFTRIKSSELIEKSWDLEREKRFQEIDSIRMSSESDRFFKFQKKYPEISLDPSGGSLGSLYLRHLKRIRDLDLAYDALNLLITQEQEFVSDFYAERGLKRTGLFTQPQADSAQIEKNDKRFYQERDAYAYAEGFAKTAEKSIFFRQNELLAQNFAKIPEYRPSILWLQKASLISPNFLGASVGRSEFPDDDLVTNAKYSTKILQIPPLPSPTPVINRKDLEFVILDRREEVRGCYEDSLRRNSSLQGSLKLSWWIDLNGRGRDLRVVSTSVNSPQLVSCLENLILGWNFPRPRYGAVKVEYPFRFVVEL